MKFRFFTLSLAAAVLVCCAKQQVAEEGIFQHAGGNPPTTVSGQDAVLKPVTIWENGCLVAFRPALEPLDTRLSISDEGVTAFEGGEAVLVSVDAGAGVKYVYDAAEGVFKAAAGVTPVRVQGESTADIYYPFDCFTVSEGHARYSIPAYTAGVLSEFGSMNPMAARARFGDETITMKNLATLIRIDLTCRTGEESAAGSVKLSTANTALSAGQAYTIDWSGEQPSFTPNEGSAADEREISFAYAAGTLDNDDVRSFYFLAPYSASGNIEGLTVSVTHNGSTYTRTRADLPRSGIRSKILYLAFRAGNFYAGTGSTGDPYQIKTVDDWCNISRTGADGLDKHYIQVADIDFSVGSERGDISRYMIGTPDASFTGSYDGQDHCLENFSLSGTEEGAGLWRFCENASFKDIHISNAAVSCTAAHVGTIVGRHDGGSAALTGCKVTCSTVSSADNYAGGLAGRANGTVSDCEFGEEGTASSVAGVTSIGGLVGLNYATVSGCKNLGAAVTGSTQAGGVIGNHAGEKTVSACENHGDIDCSGVRGGGVIGVVTKTATVSDCVNYGDVGTAANYKGGIIGSFYSQTSAATLTITNAVNHGSVTGQSGVGGIIGGTDNASAQADGVFIVIDGTTLNDGAAVTATNQNAGGIIGYPIKTTLTIRGTSCTNKATVSSKIYAGGIVAQVPVAGTISSCTNLGEVKTTDSSASNSFTGGIVGYTASADIVSCTNKATITSAKTFAGGIAGRILDGQIDLCVNSGNITATGASANNVGGITGGIYTTTVKRCYSAKGITVEGGTRVGGIVGIIEKAGQVISCASNSLILGKYTSSSVNNNVGIGFIVGVESHEDALIANCVALWDSGESTLYARNSGKSTENKVTGGLVGAKVAGTLQNSYCQVPCNKIAFVYNTSGTYVNGSSTATNGKPDYIGQIVGRNTAGSLIDCYYGGYASGSATGVRPVGTLVAGDTNNVSRISSEDKAAYNHDTTIPVAVTTSTGASFSANTVYLKDILDGGVSGITYTPAEGEVLTWSHLSETDFTPVPTAILSLVTADLN